MGVGAGATTGAGTGAWAGTGAGARTGVGTGGGTTCGGGGGGDGICLVRKTSLTAVGRTVGVGVGVDLGVGVGVGLNTCMGALHLSRTDFAPASLRILCSPASITSHRSVSVLWCTVPSQQDVMRPLEVAGGAQNYVSHFLQAKPAPGDAQTRALELEMLLEP